MKEQSAKSTNTGKKMIVFGFVIITILFLLYHRYQDPELITPDALNSIQRIAYGFYITLVAAFGAIAFGMYRYHREKIENKGKDLTTIIALATWNSKSRKIFVATFIGYGLFFSMASGTLVYQPEVNFSIHYGATIPSGFIAPCCDSPGYMPKIIVYLTEHVGLQIIPVNLVLQIVVSYLVGLNASITVSAYMISKKEKGVSTIAAATGLFIACPTCAGTFLSIFIGTASGIALSIALTQLQTLFIAISIPILVIIPYVLAKKLRNADGSCKIEPTN
ncbi:membrane protein [Nitrosopumilus sp. PRT-SC01]|nr:membrane protein [Nitrosopumilus sp. PRT-SC01]